jgi:hypothetical protein
MPEQLCDNRFIVEFIWRHSMRRVEGALFTKDERGATKDDM